MPLDGFSPVIRKNQALEDYQTPFSDYITSKFMQSFDSNPTMMLLDKARMQDTFTEDAPDAVPFRPRVDAESARQIAKDARVALNIPEEGISQNALDLLIKRKTDERARSDAINRSTTGIRSVAGIGASLAAGALDPLFLGASMIPVVAPTRYALALDTAANAISRAGVRASGGAIQGAAGMAFIEPVNYGLHQSLQDDYTALDSIMNIGFGGVLGGGLHVVGGAAKDLLLGYKPSELSRLVKTTRETPAPAITEDTHITPEVIDAVVARNEARLAETLPTSEPGAMLKPKTESLDDFADRSGTEIGGVSHLQGIFSKLQKIYVQQGREAGRAILDQMAESAPESSGFSKEVATKGFLDELDSELSKRAEQFNGSKAEQHEPGSVRADLANSVGFWEGPKPMDIEFTDTAPSKAEQAKALLDEGRRWYASNTAPARVVIAAAEPLQREAALNAAVGQSLEGKTAEVRPIFDSTVDAHQAAEQAHSPDNVRVSDKSSSSKADEVIATAPKSTALVDAERSLSEAEQRMIDRWAATGRLPEDLNKALEHTDAMAKQADELSAAAKAAVSKGCI